MSTDQVSKPRRANQSIAEESVRPGTCRSKVGCEAMEEPCTNRMVPAFGCAVAGFSHRNRRASPFSGQCSGPRTAVQRLTAFIANAPLPQFVIYFGTPPPELPEQKRHQPTNQ